MKKMITKERREKIILHVMCEEGKREMEKRDSDQLDIG